MKRIGFIDYYIDEWHANNYPTWIRESSLASKFEVALAWQEIAPPDKQSLEDWCHTQKVSKAGSIAEVVAECDCLVVLSPDNAERHEDLSDLPLRSGKPVYIDKPIAPSLAEAQRMYAKAAQYHTPLISSSALRYGSAIENAVQQVAGSRVNYVATRGPGEWDTYAIHQLEMLVMLLGTGAKRMMQVGSARASLFVIDYGDGRRGSVNQIAEHPFQLTAQFGDDGQCLNIDSMDDFFPRFIEAMLAFFDTGVVSIPKEQTLEIAALLEAGSAARKAPDTWVEVPAR